MGKSIPIGSCVKIPDGRIGRVREKSGSKFKVRVRRKTSKTHQFLMVDAHKLKSVACPKGWMSTKGYNRYLKVTLAKMKVRNARKKRAVKKS